MEFLFGQVKLFWLLFSPGLGDEMRFLGAALVCIAVLYGVDQLFFGGRYVADVDRVISEIYSHW